MRTANCPNESSSFLMCVRTRVTARMVLAPGRARPCSTGRVPVLYAGIIALRYLQGVNGSITGFQRPFE
jgi:hypothetical protein